MNPTHLEAAYDKARFSVIQLSIIEFCAEEVRRQMDGPREVYQMVSAWDFALKEAPQTPMSVSVVKHIGWIVLPLFNRGGFRQSLVWVGPRLAPFPVDVPGLMERWGTNLKYPERMIQMAHDFAVEQEKEGTVIAQSGWDAIAKEDFPACAYFAFEHIHPFADGNGRTGKVIYNWLRESLDVPTFPPAFWSIGNP